LNTDTVEANDLGRIELNAMRQGAVATSRVVVSAVTCEKGRKEGWKRERKQISGTLSSRSDVIMQKGSIIRPSNTSVARAELTRPLLLLQYTHILHHHHHHYNHHHHHPY
jgi:hypothetical protein